MCAITYARKIIQCYSRARVASAGTMSAELYHNLVMVRRGYPVSNVVIGIIVAALIAIGNNQSQTPYQNISS